MADIEAGRVDCVVVYKADRLGRGLLDSAQLMRPFEARGVSFVSVTQQYNTASSMGRLVLNVLLSFAQFEREIVGERTRDKIAATRRKGKWAGGRPALGYDREPGGRRPVTHEAERVRDIFALYLAHGSLLPVVKELARRGWAATRWADKAGRVTGGRAFTRTTLYRLLTNPLYAGRVRYEADVFPGEHPALVDPATFDTVQDRLRQSGAQGAGPESPDRFGAPLKGLLRCGACRAAMTPTFTAKRARTYRYYACVSTHKQGAGACPPGRRRPGRWRPSWWTGSGPSAATRSCSARSSTRPAASRPSGRPSWPPRRRPCPPSWPGGGTWGWSRPGSGRATSTPPWSTGWPACTTSSGWPKTASGGCGARPARSRRRRCPRRTRQRPWPGSTRCGRPWPRTSGPG
jgi:DNA invertase Pin-like site-specific DNA recombinase